MRRFSHNSGAILNASACSGDSDAVVLNGFATAPPAADAIIGVLTSMKSLSKKKFLMCCTIDDRARRISATPWSARNWTWRSYGDTSCSFVSTGTSRRHGDINLGSSLARRVNSPLPVRCGFPTIAISLISIKNEAQSLAVGPISTHNNHLLSAANDKIL